MRFNKILPYLAIAGVGYLLFFKNKTTEEQISGALQSYTPQTASITNPIKKALSDTVGGFINTVASAPSQAWNAATGNVSANQAQYVASSINQYLQQQTGTSVNYLTSQTLPSGFSVIAFTPNLPQNQALATQKVIAQNVPTAVATIAQAQGVSGSNLWAGSAGTLVAPTQVYSNGTAYSSSNASQSSATAMNMAQRMAQGLV